jgi:hypothetical protein
MNYFRALVYSGIVLTSGCCSYKSCERNYYSDTNGGGMRRDEINRDEMDRSDGKIVGFDFCDMLRFLNRDKKDRDKKLEDK